MSVPWRIQLPASVCWPRSRILQSLRVLLLNKLMLNMSCWSLGSWDNSALLTQTTVQANRFKMASLKLLIELLFLKVFLWSTWLNCPNFNCWAQLHQNELLLLFTAFKYPLFSVSLAYLISDTESVRYQGEVIMLDQRYILRVCLCLYSSQRDYR